MITSVSPARWAASTFCFSPPIGSTRPCSVTSPVIPTFGRTERPDASDASAVTIVTPGGGPVLGHRAGRDVQVDLLAQEHAGLDAELIGRGPASTTARSAPTRA